MFSSKNYADVHSYFFPRLHYIIIIVYLFLRNVLPVLTLVSEKFVDHRLKIVTDLINALPGNSSVNTVQQSTIDKDVISMPSAPNSGETTRLCNGSVNTLPRKQ
jgi:hypothetical protein